MAVELGVVVLGSGFSNAVLGLPTLRELSAWLRARMSLDELGGPAAELVEDFELLLSFWALRHPWKNEAEWLQGRSLFSRAQQELAEYIRQLEREKARAGILDWAGYFALRLTQQRATVLTFNYDTVFERMVLASVSGDRSSPYEIPYSMYGLPLSPIRARRGAALSPSRRETVRLLKLHGSTNWYCSGPEAPPGDPIFMIAPTEELNAGETELTIDKQLLIIPPVSEKSLFYGNVTLRAVWAEAYAALASARVITFVGYSLPLADLTTRLMLRAAARPDRVQIVDAAMGKESDRLEARYVQVFPHSDVSVLFTGVDSVRNLADAIR